MDERALGDAQDARRKFVHALFKQGYKQISEGCCFADVFAKPDEDKVIKVGRVEKDNWSGAALKNRDGWPAYAKWLRRVRKKSRHFPVIHQIVEHEMWFYAEIERLHPIDPSMKAGAYHNVRRACDDVLRGSSSPDITEDLKDVCQRIRRRFRGEYDIDLHKYNAMLRREPDGTETLVLTDPLGFSSSK